ncbi:hypothetical protein ABZY16_29595 [Streptomyces sp. NPDC006553]|uniref:hypothetical protein n=1 Tax=unclassified Streptomyces TaxID=2593676 RepID=UPI002259B820|nr:hypothetical protein [Streptomyces sp. NBC_00233]MCX5232294.1 hypothetical protein [Streptomyces sp. NBC_00233]
MHGTRTTAKILVGAAVAALAGCVSVDTPPTAPVPAPASAAETVRPGQDVAPQIVEGPALEALEAALPAPPPSATPRATPSPEARGREAAPPRPEAPRPESVPRQRERAETRPPLPELPAELAELPKNPPVSRADVCDLGERYGGWAPDSDPSRICHGTYGR